MVYLIRQASCRLYSTPEVVWFIGYRTGKDHHGEMGAYLNSWEAWNDWRRTGFPKLTAAQDAVDPRGIPLRIGYPTTESSLNKTNYDKAVTDLGGKDDNYAKMWWVKITSTSHK